MHGALTVWQNFILVEMAHLFSILQIVGLLMFLLIEILLSLMYSRMVLMVICWHYRMPFSSVQMVAYIH